MLNKRFRSIILLSLSFSCISSSVDSCEENKIEVENSEPSKKNKNINIAKYSLPFIVVLTCGGVCLYLKESKSDQILRQDLEKDLECDIINYLDGDKISLTRSEIRRYSSAYSHLLAKIDQDNEVKEEKVYDKLRACALFLIRSHARLRRKYKILDHDVITGDTERYRNRNEECPLSKKLQNFKKSDSKNIYENKDYLKYIWASYDQCINIGPSGPWGWYIRLNQKNMEFYYENCKPI